jgi:hypothetical protein
VAGNELHAQETDCKRHVDFCCLCYDSWNFGTYRSELVASCFLIRQRELINSKKSINLENDMLFGVCK